ncbi:MAG: GNAT family N-acetyltransferase, partial [Actinomycetota bacterium]|nr:GNAT family N-acetyltransferase [Actinomycetota bacterium]
DRDWVRSTLEGSWGSVLVARKGELLDASTFPGHVALSSGHRVGLAVCCVRGDEYEVLSLSALVEGAGVGRTLMLRCFEDAGARGCRRVWLTTTNNNIRALALYQRLGMSICAFRRDAVAAARALKPTIPLRDEAGIPIDHEMDFELILDGHHEPPD